MVWRCSIEAGTGRLMDADNKTRQVTIVLETTESKCTPNQISLEWPEILCPVPVQPDRGGDDPHM